MSVLQITLELVEASFLGVEAEDQSRKWVMLAPQ